MRSWLRPTGSCPATDTPASQKASCSRTRTSCPLRHPDPSLASPGQALVAPVASTVEHLEFHRGGSGSYPTRSTGVDLLFFPPGRARGGAAWAAAVRPVADRPAGSGGAGRRAGEGEAGRLRLRMQELGAWRLCHGAREQPRSEGGCTGAPPGTLLCTSLCTLLCTSLCTLLCTLLWPCCQGFTHCGPQAAGSLGGAGVSSAARRTAGSPSSSSSSSGGGWAGGGGGLAGSLTASVRAGAAVGSQPERGAGAEGSGGGQRASGGAAAGSGGGATAGTDAASSAGPTSERGEFLNQLSAAAVPVADSDEEAGAGPVRPGPSYDSVRLGTSAGGAAVRTPRQVYGSPHAAQRHGERAGGPGEAAAAGTSAPAPGQPPSLSTAAASAAVPARDAAQVCLRERERENPRLA
jgi:hypothetical protein